MEKLCGIYKIQSRIKPERIYIGASIDIRYRWKCHIWELRRGGHHSPKLQAHYNKYGENDLGIAVMRKCIKADLLWLEQACFDIFNPYFNTSRLYYGCAPHNPTPESNKKRSEKLKGRIPWNKGKKGVMPPPANKGKKDSWETRQKKKRARARQVFSVESHRKRARSCSRTVCNKKISLIILSLLQYKQPT